MPLLLCANRLRLEIDAECFRDAISAGLRGRETGCETKCMQPLRSDFGSIAVLQRSCLNAQRVTISRVEIGITDRKIKSHEQKREEVKACACPRGRASDNRRQSIMQASAATLWSADHDH
jgi:hypothetical protein